MTKKILVTGGAGFIGSHIVDELIKDNYKVIIVDNLSTGKKENINTKAKFYKLDIMSDELRDVFKNERPDFVNHHAAQINVRHSTKDPKFDANNNILGTVNLLECCREFNVKKFVYASSGGACYGEPENIPCSEEHPIRPISPYGLSKIGGEHYVLLYNRLHKLNYLVLRYSNVYGPRQDPNGEAGVVAIFANQFLSNKQPNIFGNGTKTRDYVYVGDVVNANILAMKKNFNGILNIGSCAETSDQQMFDYIKNLTKSNINPTYTDFRLGEIRNICLNIDKAKKELNWKPETKLVDGLRKTVEYFKNK